MRGPELKGQRADGIRKKGVRVKESNTLLEDRRSRHLSGGKPRALKREGTHKDLSRKPPWESGWLDLGPGL